MNKPYEESETFIEPQIRKLRKDCRESRAQAERLAEALKPFAKFACDEPHINEPKCQNCIAKEALSEWESTQSEDKA